MYTDPKKAYLSTKANTSVHDASPHRLIALMLDACLENLAVAKGAMARSDVPGKARAIKKSLDCIVNLQACLDYEKGGDIAPKLDDLYNFCNNRLALANASNDASMIDQVYIVMAEIKAGWAQIEVVNAHD